MKIITENITINKEVLMLTNHRAIYWQRENALILSDIHIGKTAHFRRNGIPMPDDILQKDLERLQHLILHFKPKTLLIVGDLFHAETNVDMTTFKEWLSQFEELKLVLIKGNHDRQSKKLMIDLRIKVEKELNLEPFTLVHEHLKSHSDVFTISGHTHPGVLIKGKGRQKLKLPCYQISKNQIVLPAFSLFTGLNTASQLKDSVCYAFTDESIFKF
ncbi:ligase-associated DNA damage response endonuclease PdeM [Winogradskyella jejuensis]|uniref:Putative phosphoesterase n=1 Tax=Winogradskyella jejuensis TaxID=1089305 RepID=A0A1M5TRS4_9FLAO|nr:ligase-associated DNA damage response endonuclease PdeM [Winogradskyella jejuensis]SHH53467.1 putative phosphoesterase [Winogradskyella jejuensis]